MKTIKTFLTFLTLLPFMSGCNNNGTNLKSAKEVLKNGENILRYSNGAINQIFFVKHNEKDGLFLALSKDGKVDSIGTFKDGKRFGLWLEYDSQEKPIEGYYESGKQKGEFKDKFFYDMYRDTITGYTMLAPYKWDTISTKKGVIKFGFSKMNTSSPPPNYHVMFFQGTSDVNFKETIDNQIKDLSSLEDFEIISRQDNDLIYKATVKGRKFVSFNRIIKSKSGILLLTCVCNEQSYPLYSMLFNSMIISFNPID